MSKIDSMSNEAPAVEHTSASLGLSSLLDEHRARKELLDFATLPPLLDVKTVAAMLSCSARHIYRLCDAGKMPPPLKLGALVRWSRSTVETWLAEGCPPCKKGGR